MYSDGLSRTLKKYMDESSHVAIKSFIRSDHMVLSIAVLHSYEKYAAPVTKFQIINFPFEHPVAKNVGEQYDNDRISPV